jgi:hypothetical protein
MHVICDRPSFGQAPRGNCPSQRSPDCRSDKAEPDEIKAVILSTYLDQQDDDLSLRDNLDKDR